VTRIDRKVTRCQKSAEWTKYRSRIWIIVFSDGSLRRDLTRKSKENYLRAGNRTNLEISELIDRTCGGHTRHAPRHPVHMCDNRCADSQVRTGCLEASGVRAANSWVREISYGLIQRITELYMCKPALRIALMVLSIGNDYRNLTHWPIFRIIRRLCVFMSLFG